MWVPFEIFAEGINEVKIPGMSCLKAAIALMDSADNRLNWLSSSRLSLNKRLIVFGIVKLMCCHSVLGNISICRWIHAAVAFLPQDEQNRLLQVKRTSLTCEQLVLEQT